MLASAQTASNGAIAAPATATNPDDAKTKTLVATVFGKSLCLEQFSPADADAKRKELRPAEFDKWLRGYQAARTYDNVWSAVSKRSTSSVRRSVCRLRNSLAFKSQSSGISGPRLGDRMSHRSPPSNRKALVSPGHGASFIDWKLCKSLYEKYGGRVGMGSLGLWIAPMDNMPC